MNSVNLIGRLTADPDVRTIQRKGQDDLAVANFSLAVDRGGDAGADFIRCVAFGRAAEFVETWFKKGQRVGVTGRIQTGSYDDKDGKKVYTTDVIVEHMDFADSKEAEDGDSGRRPSGNGRSRR